MASRVMCHEHEAIPHKKMSIEIIAIQNSCLLQVIFFPFLNGLSLRIWSRRVKNVKCFWKKMKIGTFVYKFRN